jgi:RNA polymerase sigma factor (sigma-70 family)
MVIQLETEPAGAPRSVPAAEIAELYAVLAERLVQIVRTDVRAPEVVIEDACQFAWTRLIHHAGRVQRESALSWLAKTAIREAFKLIRRERRELSLEAEAEQGGCGLPRAPGPEPHQLIDSRQRLDCIRGLPERQQRLLWLHALGLTYGEIARYTGDTPRTVERQLLRAKRTLRTLAPA